MKNLLLCSILVFVMAQFASAQSSYTWNGSTSTAWNVASNWTPSGVPTSADNVTIVTGSRNCVLAASTTIKNLTFTSGTLDLGNYTLTVSGTTATFTAGTIQNGVLTISNATTATIGNTSSSGFTMNCALSVIASTLTITKTTFQSTTIISKTGSTNDQSQGNNVFNGAVTFTNSGSGYLLLGNTNPDQFNAAATFTNTGSNYIYVAYNSSNNVFNGITTFTNAGTLASCIYVGWNSTNTGFNNNIIVNSTNGNGVQFCGGSTTATAVLVASKTISIGTTGFTAGSLLLNRFTQTGNTAQSLTFTGTATFNCNSGNIFNGALTVNAPNIYLANSTFNGITTLNKTDGINSNAMSGGNTFGADLYVNYISTTGTGYWSFGNGTRDIYNGDVYSNNNSLDRIIFGHASSNNQFNGNLILTQIGSSVGTTLTWNGGSSVVMAVGKTVSIGTAGFSVGYLSLSGLIQNGSTPMNLTTTGNSSIYFGEYAGYNQTMIGGVATFTAPDIYVRGGTFNSRVTFNKTGGTSDHNNQRQNIFNASCTINQQSSGGYFMLGYNSNDLFNDSIIVSSTTTGGIYLGWQPGSTGTPTLAAGKNIFIGSAGYTAGVLALGGFIQQGTTSGINLTLTGTSVFYVFKTSTPCVFNGVFNVTAPDMWIEGGTFNNRAYFTKTGGNSNHNNQQQNIFNASCTINQQSSGGYFMLGYNSNDLFNDSIIVSSTGTGGIYLGWQLGSTGTPTLAAGKNIFIGSAGFSAGSLNFGGFTQLGNSTGINLTLTGSASLYFYKTLTPCVFNGVFNVTAPDIWVEGATFNNRAYFTKTGGNSNHNNQQQNIFYASCNINQQSNTGYFMLGYNSNDLFNDSIIISSTGSGGIYFGWGSGTGTPTLASGKSIYIGSNGFSNGFLMLNTFTQLGTAPINLTMTGTSAYVGFARNSIIGGNVILNTPSIYFNGGTFNGTVDVTKSGMNSDNSSGGNTFNGTVTMTNNGAGYLLLGNGNPDVFNASVTFINNGSNQIYVAYSSTNNVFNGATSFINTPSANVGIYVSWYGINTVFNDNITVGSTNGQGIQFCGASNATAVLSAGKTINVASGGFSAGTLLLQRFTQLGNAAINLSMTGTSTINFGTASTFGGNINSNSGGILFNGSTFNGTLNCTKSGVSGDWGLGGNTFNAASTFINNGSSYLLFGGSNADTWNADATFTNNSSERVLIAYSSAGTQFNGNIYLNTSGSAQGIGFCAGNNTATVALASGKTIQAGFGGLNAGYVILKQFTQNGSGTLNLNMSSTASYIQFGPSSTFGADITTTSPGLYFNGGTFNATVNSTKTGASNDAGIGNNIFNAASTFINNGSGYFIMGNGSPDVFNSTATFINNSSAQHMYIAYNSTGNIFNGDVNITNQPSANNLLVYLNSYGINTQYNGNILVNNVNGGGVYFGANTGNAILASSKTVKIGGSGFNTGGLIFKNFIQSGTTTPQTLTTTGNSYIQFGPASQFDGIITSSSPGLFFNGCTFNSAVNCTKNGTTNDQSAGNNNFNASTTITNSGTGYFMLAVTTADAYNGDVIFVQNSTGILYPNYNNTCTYNGNVTTSAPTASAITFGSGNGTAKFIGTSQSISKTAGLTTIFNRLQIASAAAGSVTLNTPVNISNALTMTNGLINTTSTNILTMLNASTTAVGTATSTSYVNGPMKYIKSAAGVTTLNFPIGFGTDCRPFVLTVNHSNSTQYSYTAQLYNHSAAALNYYIPVTVKNVSLQHYYTITRADASGTIQPTQNLSGNQTIQIFFGINDSITDGPNLTIVKNTYNATNSWIDIGGSGAPTNTGRSLIGSVTSTSLPSQFNSFSTFALGNKMGGANVLPITLISFTAQKKDNETQLDWVTETESMSDYFSIERSTDGVDFESINKVKSQAEGGNSRKTLAYQSFDEQLINGYNYYRLKHFNTDGSFEYSDIVAIDFKEDENAKEDENVDLVNSLENPALRITTNNSNANLILEIYNEAGQLLKSVDNIVVQNNSQEILPLDLAMLPHGLYIAVLSNPTKKRKKSYKVVK